MKLLIVKISAIGDVVMTLPVISAFRNTFPDIVIDWVVGEAAASLLHGHAEIDRVIVYPQKALLEFIGNPVQWPCLMSTASRFINTLRFRRYDLVLDFQGLLKSGLVTGLSRAEIRSGFAGGREGSSLFLTHRLPAYDPDMHAVDRYLKLASSHGALVMNRHDFPLSLQESELKHADAVLLNAGIRHGERFAALMPGTAWKSKMWTSAGFARLADMIKKRWGIPSVLTGAAADAGISSEIISKASVEIADVTGKTSLRVLAGVYKRAAVVISVDTGPMHLAVASGSPVVALFGPTAPWRTGPYGSKHQVLTASMRCAPCFQRECSFCHCMLSITPEMVMDAVGKVLQCETD